MRRLSLRAGIIAGFNCFTNMEQSFNRHFPNKKGRRVVSNLTFVMTPFI